MILRSHPCAHPCTSLALCTSMYLSGTVHIHVPLWHCAHPCTSLALCTSMYLSGTVYIHVPLWHCAHPCTSLALCTSMYLSGTVHIYVPLWHCAKSHSGLAATIWLSWPLEEARTFNVRSTWRTTTYQGRVVLFNHLSVNNGSKGCLDVSLEVVVRVEFIVMFNLLPRHMRGHAVKCQISDRSFNCHSIHSTAKGSPKTETGNPSRWLPINTVVKSIPRWQGSQLSMRLVHIDFCYRFTTRKGMR